jgi:hypothetical protein
MTKFSKVEVLLFYLKNPKYHQISLCWMSLWWVSLCWVTWYHHLSLPIMSRYKVCCRGAQHITGDNPKSCLGRVFNFKLGCFAQQQHESTRYPQPLLELNTRSRLGQLGWSLYMSNSRLINTPTHPKKYVCKYIKSINCSHAQRKNMFASMQKLVNRAVLRPFLWHALRARRFSIKILLFI